MASGDVGVRGLILGFAVFAALAAAGCAKKESAAARIEGAEPQRLSFGDPVSVQRAFVHQMKQCWFAGPGSLLDGYPYDLTPSVIDDLGGAHQIEQVMIFDRQDTRKPAFVIQFHAFNDNTLIATRNLAFPQIVAAQLKRDVETWVIGGSCAATDNLNVYGRPPAASGDLKSSEGQQSYGSASPSRVGR